MRRGRLWIELIFEKERPEPKTEGRVVGMDSNYRNGLVFSDGQVFCGYSDHADFKAAKTLALLGLAGAYGLRSLSNLTFASVQH